MTLEEFESLKKGDKVRFWVEGEVTEYIGIGVHPSHAVKGSFHKFDDGCGRIFIIPTDDVESNLHFIKKLDRKECHESRNHNSEGEQTSI